MHSHSQAMLVALKGGHYLVSVAGGIGCVALACDNAGKTAFLPYKRGSYLQLWTCIFLLLSVYHLKVEIFLSRRYDNKL